MRINLVIFDLDGVLVDSEVLSARVLIEVAAEAGVRFDMAHVRERFLGRSFPTVARSIREDFGLELPEGFEAAYRGRLLERFESELRPMPGVLDLLPRLRVASCVATSSSPPRAARSLALAGLDRFFPRVFTASLVERGKPAPDLFLHAAAEMGVGPERCLVVEDSRPGLLAARAAGMQAAFLAAGSHLRGLAGWPDLSPAVRPLMSWTDVAEAYPALFHPELEGIVP